MKWVSVTYHDQINQRNGIQRDAPPIHETEQINNDHGNRDQHDYGRVDIKAE